MSVFVILAFSVFGFTSCLKDAEPQPCTYDSCALKAPAAEIAAVQAYLDSMNITGVNQHCSGLFYRIENPGTGIAPEACSAVNASYKGMLTNGTVFETQTTGINFTLSSVIRGWTNGLPLIKEGGRIHLYIPPTLGYGTQERRDQSGALVIPANSILIFEVNLARVY